MDEQLVLYSRANYNTISSLDPAKTTYRCTLALGSIDQHAISTAAAHHTQHKPEHSFF
jgi:hypothetical protein